MPVKDAVRIRRELEELGKACVIAGHRAGKIVQVVPQLAADVNNAMTAFNSAFQALRKATAKLAALNKGDDVEDQDPA